MRQGQQRHAFAERVSQLLESHACREAIGRLHNEDFRETIGEPFVGGRYGRSSIVGAITLAALQGFHKVYGKHLYAGTAKMSWLALHDAAGYDGLSERHELR